MLTQADLFLPPVCLCINSFSLSQSCFILFHVFVLFSAHCRLFKNKNPTIHSFSSLFRTVCFVCVPIACFSTFFFFFCLLTFKKFLNLFELATNSMGVIKVMHTGKEDILCLKGPLACFATLGWMKDFLCSRNPVRGAAVLLCSELS